MGVVDVVVVGAGAAGLMAAVCAAQSGAEVVLLEKNRKAGLKILISGGGRCNLTTTRSGRELEREYGERRGRWLRHALRAFQPRDLCRMIEAVGVRLHEEDLEKIFPVSGRAKDVVDALLRMAATAGVAIRYESPMLSLARRDGGGFTVCVPQGIVQARTVIVASGGLSYPRTGASGDGYAACMALGHSLVPPVAALAPLWIESTWVRELAGIVVDGVDLSVVDRHGQPVGTRRRPILFTHKGLSGPAPMDLSGLVEERGGGCTLKFDFVPSQPAEQLHADLVEMARRHGARAVAHALPAALPERLRQALTALAGATVRVADLGKTARAKLVALLKGATVGLERSLGFAHAEVTRGGIPLDEIDGRTMRSRVVPDLFLCGEVIDVDGPIGGFNFQAAFATGRLAGLHAAAAVLGSDAPR